MRRRPRARRRRRRGGADAVARRARRLGRLHAAHLGEARDVRQPQREQELLRRAPEQGHHRRVAQGGEDALRRQRRRHELRRRDASDAQSERRRVGRRRPLDERDGRRARRDRVAPLREGEVLAARPTPAEVARPALETARGDGDVLEVQHGVQRVPDAAGLAGFLAALRRHRRVRAAAGGQKTVEGVPAALRVRDAAAVLLTQLRAGRNWRARAGGGARAGRPPVHAARHRAPGVLRARRAQSARHHQHQPVQHVGGHTGARVPAGASGGGRGGARAEAVSSAGPPGRARRRRRVRRRVRRRRLRLVLPPRGAPRRPHGARRVGDAPPPLRRRRGPAR